MGFELGIDGVRNALGQEGRQLLGVEKLKLGGTPHGSAPQRFGFAISAAEVQKAAGLAVMASAPEGGTQIMNIGCLLHVGHTALQIVDVETLQGEVGGSEMLVGRERLGKNIAVDILHIR